MFYVSGPVQHLDSAFENIDFLFDLVGNSEKKSQMMNFGLKTLLFQSAPVCTRSLFWAEAK
jgi:hypothetical protein